MKTLQVLTDKTAIGLSLLCTIHCLALPVLLVALPSMTALNLENEAFHLWMLAAVIPTSAYALTMGCREHKRYQLLPVGLLGMVCLVLAIVIGEAIESESIEKMLTFIGASIIALGHIKNYKLCRHSERCQCPEHKDKYENEPTKVYR